MAKGAEGGGAHRARTKPLPKPWVEPCILWRVVKATPAAVARVQGSMVQPLLVQVPLVTFFRIFLPSNALEASTACIALYCTFLCMAGKRTLEHEKFLSWLQG